MANTEGMTDEAMNELLSAPASSASSSAFARRQQRLNIPMGERPAAKVIRPSKNRGNPIKVSTVQETESQEEKKPLPPPVIVGGVVERPITDRVVADKTSGSKQPGGSHFAQSRVKPQPGGFPSMHNKPLGTFARRSKAKKSVAPSTEAGSQSAAAQQDSNNNGNDNAATAAIHRDSEALLAQMSKHEIEESVAELRAAMSPEMIAFLKKRRQQKQQRPTTGSASTTVARPQQTAKPQAVFDEEQEKQRLAQIMSSIRTYDDMDAVYAQEQPRRPEDDDGLGDKTEWEQACSLLRSTSPRQTLWAARIVCQHVEEDLCDNKSFSMGSTFEDEWPYPVLLPVSLRCLLDATVTHTNGLVMHTYVLRSLYALLRMRAPIDHVVDVTVQHESSCMIHERLLLDDAVPTPAFGSLYPSVAATPVVKDGDTTIAYATASSSTSAQQDGEAFLRDPLWTLMTKMRIVPRVAQLLQSQHDLPEEALIAMSGILAMLSLRSPGAASAIAQHETLLSSLLKKTVLPPVGDGEDSNFLNPNVMLPVMILLNTMARQSRVVAAKIPYMSILPPLLAISDADQELLRVQQWGLILWRKLLRYGMGLSGLSSLVSLSIQHVAEASVLAPHYYSVFAACLDCVKVFKKTKSNRSRLENTLRSSDVDNLMSAVSWFKPSVRACMGKVNLQTTSDALTLQASILRFIMSYVAALEVSKSENEEDSNSLNLVEELPLLFECLVQAMEKESFKGIVDRIHFVHADKAMEASESAFLSALIACVGGMESNLNYHGEASQIMCTKLRAMLRSSLVSVVPTSQEIFKVDRCRQGWRKQCHFAVANFLMDGVEDASSLEGQAAIRLFSIDLIGRLDLGDEAKAAILLSKEMLCRTSTNDFAGLSLSGMFMRELCTSDANRKQLDHSFKLQHGFGVTSDGWGPFATEALLSDADRGPGSSSVGLLPMGKTWLWQVLAGSLGVDATAAKEVCSITTSCLDFLMQVEEEHTLTLGGSFDSVPAGAKVYFLFNIFLYPESILGNETLRSKASALLDKCAGTLLPTFGADFVLAALNHSNVKTKTGQDGNSKKDERLLAVLTGVPDASSKAMRVVTEFCIDLCNVYIEYGAQYEEFTKAIRVLLRPQLPSKIRCVVLGRLREVSHLLGLEKEETEKSALKVAIEELLLDGIAPRGERDAADLLNTLADILRRRQQGRVDDFFSLFATATLSRALLGALQVGSTGIAPMKRRLLELPHGSAILATCSAKPQTRTVLVEAVLEACSSMTTQKVDEETLEAWFVLNTS